MTESREHVRVKQNMSVMGITCLSLTQNNGPIVTRNDGQAAGHSSAPVRLGHVNQRYLDINRLFCHRIQDNDLWLEINRLMDDNNEVTSIETKFRLVLSSFECLSDEEQELEETKKEEEPTILRNIASGKPSNWKGTPLTLKVLCDAIEKLRVVCSEL